MRTILLPLCFLLFTLNSSAQTATAPDTAKKIFTYVDQMPSPKFKLSQYLQENLHYPDNARENNIEGRVIVKFIVDKKGRVEDCTIVKGIGGGCDEEALRVVENMPRWKPGKNKGKRIKVYYTLPIVFKLT